MSGEEKELLTLFAHFIADAEKEETTEIERFRFLKDKIRKNIGDFPSAFADGALKLLQELHSTLPKDLDIVSTEKV